MLEMPWGHFTICSRHEEEKNNPSPPPWKGEKGGKIWDYLESVKNQMKPQFKIRHNAKRSQWKIPQLIKTFTKKHVHKFFTVLKKRDIIDYIRLGT